VSSRTRAALALCALLAGMAAAGTVEHPAGSHEKRDRPKSTWLLHQVDHARNAAQNCRRRLEGHGWPVEFLERRTSSLPLRRWVLRRWTKRARETCAELRRVIERQNDENPGPSRIGVWYWIAVCESSLGTGRPQWHINTGNGFYGGLQFLTSTWLAYGGGRYAARADLATPMQQVAIASRMALTHWPVCGAPYR
jgi:hypothetical protein